MEQESSGTESLSQQTPVEAVKRPHGCLTAFLVSIPLFVAMLGGIMWLFSFLFRMESPSSQLHTGVGAAYAAVLLVPFTPVAILLRGERFALWRGVALTLALAGGHAALGGAILSIDFALPWPGLPAALLPVVSLIYGLAVVMAGRRRFLHRPSLELIFLGVGLAMLLSIPWVIVGALGLLSEALLAILEAAGAGLVSAVLLATLFFYDREMPRRRPFWSAVLVGVTFWALKAGLLAIRGYWVQGIELSLTLVPFGFVAGVLLTLDAEDDSLHSWWSVLAFFFVVFLIPFAWTEGFEGDWMMDDMTPAWMPGLIAGQAAGWVLGAVALIAHPWLDRFTSHRLPYAGLGGGATVMLLAAYLSFGQPGLQPNVFFVVLADQANTDFAQDIEDRGKRMAAVYQTLTAHALDSQADLRAFLDARGAVYTPYYLVNGIEVEGTPLLRRQIAARPDVAYVLNSPHTRPLPPFSQPTASDSSGVGPPETLPWGVDQMDAELVWEEFGITGEGIIVGHADSGVDWTHPALRSQYVGAAGDHDYTWFDPWYGTTEPTDHGGHGTHTLGIILGQDGIGIAPDAQWIACRNLAHNLGNPAYYLDCMQFFLAPHPQDGDPFTEGDPSRGAHVTNNSWGCPPEEGCDGLTLPIAIRHLRNAGQMFVVSAGNEGPECSTVWSPATADEAFSVGAIDRYETITGFSSRGPVLLDESGRVKPDVVAPGVDIYSSKPAGVEVYPGESVGYAAWSGTSMAGPHVTGLVVLLWSANPALIGDIDATEQIITGTAHYVAAPGLCGGGTDAPNNVYGYGYIDALDAIRAALGVPEQ